MRGLKVGRALFVFWLLTLAYIGALLWVDHDNGLLSGFERLASLLPVLMLFSAASYLVRYLRWYWLLARAKVVVPPLRGLVAYLCGFAFTVSPGKIGELVRIRYFGPLGARPEMVFSAFVYERAFDLIVVLALASISVAGHGVFPIAVMFVALVLTLVLLLARFPHHGLRVAGYLQRRRLRRTARCVEVLASGFAQLTAWFRPLDLLVCLTAGFVAWGLTAYAFVLLLDQLGLSVPVLWAFSLYPLAMLAGAASMIPGGIGSTEAVLIALLAGVGISVADGAIAAIGIRLATLWFATFLGLLSMLTLDFVSRPVASLRLSSR